MKNKNYFLITNLFLLFLFFQGFDKFSDHRKLSKSLTEELTSLTTGGKSLIWVTFMDKGNNLNHKLSHPEVYLTDRAIERRKKVKLFNSLVDYTDLPLNYEYLNEIAGLGLEIKNKSKWFNRISCYATRSEIIQLSSYDFVKKMDLVKTFKKSNEDVKIKSFKQIGNEASTGNSNRVYSLDYGNSLFQMQMINVPIAHDSGYMGQGVLIASFDTGFDNLQHPVFDSLRSRGIRTYDFVNHDTNVANEPGQMGDGGHGTVTLSLVGGFKPGSLISPAFRSSYILAKTENTESETPIEEDNWISAAEWADSLGADIITSSLSYREMDPGSGYSYNWTWMNGDSCLITIGADMAVNKGIIVCNAAANNGFHPTQNTLGAPGDGDSVITVGAVDTNGRRSSFSSVGLTTDGRIKPDVVALGNGNYVAAPGSGNTGFIIAGGTSSSCPMTAGVCALILSANYDLTPMQVRGFLTQTADSSFAPNRRRGWGLINCWEAIELARKFTGYSNTTTVVKGYSISQNYPNPFNPSTKINYDLPVAGYVTLKVYNILGEEVSSLVNQYQNAGSYAKIFDARLSASTGGLKQAYNLSSGIYFYKIHAGDFVSEKKMILLK